MIYFVRRVGGGDIKIGMSACLSARLMQLEKMVGCELVVLGVMDGSFYEEKSLHREFATICREGEWFDPAASLLDFIANKCRPWDGCDDLPAISSVVALKGSLDMEQWLDMLVKKTESGTRTNALRRGLRALADEYGVKDPIPDR